MSETQLTEGQEILAILRRLEGVAFAGQLAVAEVRDEGCTCQNCPCNAKRPGGCGCHPKCSCQGVNAHDKPDQMDELLGAAAVLQLEDIKTLKAIRERLVQARARLNE